MLNSGIEQLMKQLLKINWTGMDSSVNFFVLVLVKRARTAQYLANYLSNCGLLRGVQTTSFAGHGGGSADNGEILFTGRGGRGNAKTMEWGCAARFPKPLPKISDLTCSIYDPTKTLRYPIKDLPYLRPRSRSVTEARDETLRHVTQMT